MKKLALSVVMALGVSAGAFAATPVTLGTVGPLAFAAYLVAIDGEQACDKEPLRKVAWKDNPNGYTFTVAGCDFQAKKDRLIEVK